MLFSQFFYPFPSRASSPPVVADALVEAGADGVILNHDGAKPMTFNQLLFAMDYAKKVGLYTFVCADTIEEIRLIAQTGPTGIICEQSRLIGTGVTAPKEYLLSTTAAVKEIDENIIVMQGAGIKNSEDVYRNIKYGSESGGGASGIFLSDDPIANIDEFLAGILKAKKEFGSKVY